MKPIEAGCLCLSLDSKVPGSCIARFFVAGGTFFNSPQGLRQTIKDGWSVQHTDSSVANGLPCMVASRDLLRIDDYDPSQDAVEDDKEMEKC